MGALSIRNVCKSFGSTDILKGIDLEVAEGEFLILVGPSGCGKSTLLNMIAGLDSITSGEIRIAGRRVNELSPKDRDIAMVFQSYALYPNMTVRQNISFGLEIRKVPKDEQKRIVEQVASTLQMSHLLDRKPAQLSGGQRQRVAMGRAISRNPALFLFDEPLSNLDAKLRVEMRTEIKLLHGRVGKAIVYVTHDQIEAMTLGDKIAVMKAGVVQQFGTPREVYDNPANLFVAGFMGSPSMNFLPCEIVPLESGLGVRLESECATFSLPIPGGKEVHKLAAGKQVILGIRPEQITARAEWQHENCGRARVTVVEPTGPDTLVIISLNGKPVTCRLHPTQVRDPGEEIELAFDMSKVVFFDPKTEQRLA
jgi:multiple sugar transport system ATP-binding protein